MTRSEDHGEYRTAPWALIGVLAVLFVGLALLAGMVGTLPADLPVTQFVQRAHGSVARAIWHVGNACGTTAWASILFGLVLAGMIGLRAWCDVAFLLILMVGRILARPIKGIVESPRPSASQVHIIEVFDGYGFPSGHTLTSTILFGGVAFLVAGHVRRSWMPSGLICVWVLGIAFTGFARVWSGAHWPSDVFGAILLGVTIVLIAANLSYRFVPPVGKGTRTREKRDKT